MNVESVDPRDVRWEHHSTTYRVYFWRQIMAPSAEAGAQGGDAGWQCDERRITRATDVHEVLHWAARYATDGTFTVYAETTTATGEVGLLRLAGTNPTGT